MNQGLSRPSSARGYRIGTASAGLAATAAFAFAAATPTLAENTPGLQIRTGSPVGLGWQATGVFNFPAGRVSQQIGYNCPAQYPLAVSGAYAFNAIGQTTEVSLSFNGPRFDESPPSYAEWGWHFYFPKGAPAGTSVLLTLFCM